MSSSSRWFRGQGDWEETGPERRGRTWCPFGCPEGRKVGRVRLAQRGTVEGPCVPDGKRKDGASMVRTEKRRDVQ